MKDIFGVGEYPDLACGRQLQAFVNKRVAWRRIQPRAKLRIFAAVLGDCPQGIQKAPCGLARKLTLYNFHKCSLLIISVDACQPRMGGIAMLRII